MRWARARGEGVVLSHPLGFEFDIGVFGWTLPLVARWGRDGGDVLELVAALPYLFRDGDGQLESTAPKVLAVNADSARRGVGFSVVGGMGVSARAIVFLDEDRVHSEQLESALRNLRAALREHAGRLVALGDAPFDTRYEDALRPVTEELGIASPTSEIFDDAALRGALTDLQKKFPSPLHIEAQFIDSIIQLLYRLAKPMDIVTAARATGNSMATILYKDDSGDTFGAGTVFLANDGGCTWLQLARAWRALVADLRWGLGC
jgi:hypothetical protein